MSENTVTTLRTAGIMRESIVDGPGIRFAIFCQGCPHNCPGCHNPGTHDFSGGKDISILRIKEEIDKDPILRGVTFSGGEPMCQPEAFLELAKLIKGGADAEGREAGRANGRGKPLDIMIYTGYTFEELSEKRKTNAAIDGLLEICDYLVDGRFVLAQRDLTLRFRGSQNQRFIDMNRTRAEGRIVLAE